MKTAIIFKEFSDLSPVAVQVAHPTAPAISESPPQADDSSGEDFREMLRRRSTTPFVSAISYHRWGLNE